MRVAGTLVTVFFVVSACTPKAADIFGRNDNDDESSQGGEGGQGASQGTNGSTETGHHPPTTGQGPEGGSNQGAGGEPGQGAAGQGGSPPGPAGPGAGGGGVGGGNGNGCYYEPFTNANISNIENSYVGSQWLQKMLATLDARYPNGHYLMDQMKSDPWLTGTFPSYFELGSWDGMIDAIDTACHEETHGYDYDQALSLPNKHLYYMGSDNQVQVPKLGFFPRNAILSLVQQGGSVTTNYDNTYLTGTQGSYDFISMGDELTAYINGLACVTTVQDYVTSTVSYRDGAASHLYYLQLYMRVARTEHASLYNQWKADPDWQHFVRYSWARGHFWTAQAAGNPHLGINDAAIWARINQQQNLDEIELFTGDSPDEVACNP